MNVPGTAGPETVTRESLLLAAVERAGRYREGRLAVQIHLSALRPQNRQEGHLRIALRMLEPMVNAYRGQMFLLSNSDIVFLLKDANVTDVGNMVFKLRALFSKDPVTFADSGDGVDRFCSWFELDSPDYEAFLGHVREAAAAAQAKAREIGEAAQKPLDARALGDILNRIIGLDLAGCVRRQSAIIVNPTNATVLFQEFFIAMAELQRLLAPDLNLLGNRWLFQHLSQTLDQKVLTALHEVKLRLRPEAFNLNLNIATVLGPVLEAFARGEADGTAVTVEFQVLDVLADAKGFYAARQRLQEAGHRVALDGLNELTLQFMDVAQVGADLHKITWSPELRGAEHGAAVGRVLRALPADKLLLARCDSEAAINWGLENGVQRFQGRYVDAMLAAYTMQMCTLSSGCTLQQCIARRAVISGPLRAECVDLDMLDRAPVIRALKLAASREAAP
jgi:hypothetical protein